MIPDGERARTGQHATVPAKKYNFLFYTSIHSDLIAMSPKAITSFVCVVEFDPGELFIGDRDGILRAPLNHLFAIPVDPSNFF